jgi:hypothetical protein
MALLARVPVVAELSSLIAGPVGCKVLIDCVPPASTLQTALVSDTAPVLEGDVTSAYLALGEALSARIKSVSHAMTSILFLSLFTLSHVFFRFHLVSQTSSEFASLSDDLSRVIAEGEAASQKVGVWTTNTKTHQDHSFELLDAQMRLTKVNRLCIVFTT